MSTITEVQQMDTMHMRLPLSSQPNPASPATAARRHKIKLDPLRALEPARKKLSTIESQRVMCVLEDTKKRCDVISSLPHIMKNMDKFAALVGPEVGNCFADHKKIHDKFATLELRHTDISLQITNAETAREEGDEATSSPQPQPTPPASRPVSRGLSSRGSMRYRQSPAQLNGAAAPSASDLNEQLEAITSQIKMVELELHISIKNMMRILGLNPGVVNLILAEVGNSRSRESMFFTTQLQELRDILMEKLLMTPIEEKEKMHYLSQVGGKIKLIYSKLITIRTENYTCTEQYQRTSYGIVYDSYFPAKIASQ